MNYGTKFNLLKQLCIPSMIDALNKIFLSNEGPLSHNASLNVSKIQLSTFALSVLLSHLQYDIKRLAESDPAAMQSSNKAEYVWESYKGLKAIMYYRIAHHLLDFDNNNLITQSRGYFESEEDNENIQNYMRLQARKLSERAAIETTIEINPSAIIGKGFVIDHGVGTKVAFDHALFSTVIGETCIIGDNCTLLNSVLIGAAVINEAESKSEGLAIGKRHPTLGNNVTVCAGARILGNIKIGSNVTIGPCCVITSDVPDGYDVTIVNQLQYSRPNKMNKAIPEESKPIIHGLTIDENNRFKLFGKNLNNCTLSIVTQNNDEEETIPWLSIIPIEQNSEQIVFMVKSTDTKVIAFNVKYSLCIRTNCFEYILNEPNALTAFIDLIGQKGESK